MLQKTTARVESADRALQILALLLEHGEISVTHAADALGVAPSTAHRLLATLCYREFAQQGPRRRYVLGRRLLPLDGQEDPAEGLRRTVRPALERLFERVGETVHLMVLDGPDVRFVDGIEGGKVLRVGLRTGARMPACTTSGGKAMLAELPPHAVASLYAHGVPDGPDGHPKDMAQLVGELAQVRQQRLGVNRDESEPGVSAIGAAITGAGHVPMAALTVAIPTARIADAEGIADALVEVCRELRAVLSGAATG